MGDQNEEPLMYYEEATASQHIDISTVEKMREVWSVGEKILDFSVTNESHGMDVRLCTRLSL